MEIKSPGLNFTVFLDDRILVDFRDLGSNEVKLVVYDSKNGTFNIPEILNMNCLMEPVVYIESLILP